MDNQRRLVSYLVPASLFAGVLFACGGSSEVGNSGANTAGKAGSAGTAGANTAGQAGSAGTAGGGDGGTAGSAGNAGTAGNGGLAGSGGSAGTAGNGGTGGTAGAAGNGGSGGTGTDDDPCPEGSVLDCSGQCGASADPLCEKGYCGHDSGGIVLGSDFIPPYTDFPMTVRTPARPGLDPDCDCEWERFGIQFRVSNPNDSTVRLSVEPPWWIEFDYRDYDDYCRLGRDRHQCVVVEDAIYAYVLTSDPDAPARNLTIDWGASCQ